MALVYCQPRQRYGGIRTSIPTMALSRLTNILLLLVPEKLKREQSTRMSTSFTTF